MPRFKVAHLNEQGQNMLLFPLESSIHAKLDSEKSDILNELEARANASGLAGSAAIFWKHGNHVHFMGPRQWHSFLGSLGWSGLLANVNKEISWTD